MSDDTPQADPLRMFCHAYAVTALNPKSIIFFVAFVPQFLDATRPFLPQVVTLEATFVILATLNATRSRCLPQRPGRNCVRSGFSAPSTGPAVRC